MRTTFCSTTTTVSAPILLWMQRRAVSAVSTAAHSSGTSHHHHHHVPNVTDATSAARPSTEIKPNQQHPSASASAPPAATATIQHSSATIDAVNAAAGALAAFLASCHQNQSQNDGNNNVGTQRKLTNTTATTTKVSRIINKKKKPVMITGAGVSTASGIPDYRGPKGLYHRGHRPMTFQEFLRPEHQARYMARSFVGYRNLLEAHPNPAHLAIGELYTRGVIGHIVTQNVDGLHGAALAQLTGDQPQRQFYQEDDRNHHQQQRTGGASASSSGAPSTSPLSPSSPSYAVYQQNYRDMCVTDEVTELHGNLHVVVCLKCGDVSCRRELQCRLAKKNDALLQDLGIVLDYTRFDGCPVAETTNVTAATAADDGGSSTSSTTEITNGRRKNEASLTSQSLDGSGDGDPLTSTSSKTHSVIINQGGPGGRGGRSAGAAGASASATGAEDDDDGEEDSKIRPDGDAEVSQRMMDQMKSVPCLRCGAINALKPDVVFFGESVPKGRVDGVFRQLSSTSSSTTTTTTATTRRTRGETEKQKEEEEEVEQIITNAKIGGNSTRGETEKQKEEEEEVEQIITNAKIGGNSTRGETEKQKEEEEEVEQIITNAKIGGNSTRGETEKQKEEEEEVEQIITNASALICCGTSLTVYSALRFVIRASELGIPICIVNNGETRGDKYATLKIGGNSIFPSTSPPSSASSSSTSTSASASASSARHPTTGGNSSIPLELLLPRVVGCLDDLDVSFE